MDAKPTHEEMERKLNEFRNEIIALKQIQTALQDSETRLKALSDASFEAIFLFKNGICLDQNQTAERMFGHTRTEAVGRHVTEWIIPEDHEQVKNNMASGYEKPYGVTALKKDGDTFPAEIQARMADYQGRSIRITALRDTSDRQQTEEALRQSEEKYKSLTNNLNVGVYRNSVGSKGNFMEANPAIVKMFEYDSKEEFLKIGVSDLYKNPEERKEFISKIGNTGSIKNEVLELQKKDGTAFIGSVSAVAVKNIKGDIKYFDGIIEDITDRKQAEEALKTMETTYRNIFLNSQIGLFRTDVNTGQILDANDAVAQFIGFKDRNELLAEPFNIVERYVDPKDREEIVSLLKTHGEFRNYEARYRSNDGTIIWMRFSARIVPERGWMEGVSEDISDQKLAEVSLRESEDRFSKLFFSSPTWVSISRLEDGTFIDVNNAFEEMTGFDRKDVIGKTSLELGLWHEPEERERQVSLVRAKGGFREAEVTFFTKSGEPRTSLWSADAIDVGDEPCLISTVMDITRLRKAETEKEMLQARLYRSQKMEALGTLAGGVAHDLNNILGGLVGYPELLLLQLPEDSPLRKSISTIQKSGEKATAVVQDLLTLARRGVIVRETIDLNDVITEYMKSPEYEKLLFYHPGVHLETHFDKNLFNILGSPMHLSNTIMNLISNAAEAMPDGGKVVISTENRYVDRPIKNYDSVKKGDYVVVMISDTGSGIPPNDLKKIFEPFYTKKKMGRSGTGLGMAVAWGTVKDHYGYIDVQSTENKGTVFMLYFPATREKLTEEKSSLAISDYRGSGESILVVDDVEEQRQIASGMLKELGYSVVSVSSGEEAIQYLKTNKVDLLVLDMIMAPGMNGLDTYKRILEMHPGQKAIIASGFSETERVKEVQRLGAGAYIKKPFLLEKIGLGVKEELHK